jgi:hypothetical protein
MRYIRAVTSKKGVMGCGSPQARGAEPHPARFAAFLFLDCFGGPNGRARALPVTLRVPRSSTPVRTAAQCGSCAVVVYLAQLEQQRMKKQPKAVQAIYDTLSTEQQRRAFAVVDAVDHLDSQLGALRAVECLVINEKLVSEEYMPQLKRGDLAMLLSVLTSNLETHCAYAREAAVICAKGVA